MRLQINLFLLRDNCPWPAILLPA